MGSLRILHFSDAHIDMVSQGRHDPVTNLPFRVLDYLKALDQIVDYAVDHKVDLVIFAGDAYKDRNPAPTYMREWGKRVMRISQAGIPMIILVGNHDLSPATGRAHAMQEFDTLEVPHVHVISKPCLLRPQDLEGLPIQLIGLPWISRSGIIASMELNGLSAENIYAKMEERLSALVDTYIQKTDPSLPLIFTAHASVVGAKYGEERGVMLGGDLSLSGSLVRDPRIDYVALGHIHKAQNMNEDTHPPVIYPGSIERMNFGEAKDKKYFCLAEIERGKTSVEWIEIPGRKFIDRYIILDSVDTIQERLERALPGTCEVQDAIIRLTLEYPRGWEPHIDEGLLRRKAEGAFEFHLVRRPQSEGRIRLSSDQMLASLTSLELLDVYWKTIALTQNDIDQLKNLARQVIGSDQTMVEMVEGSGNAPD